MLSHKTHERTRAATAFGMKILPGTANLQTHGMPMDAFPIKIILPKACKKYMLMIIS
jgi:hypothetical protein